MDAITESLLNEFAKEHELSSLPEEKKFEHFSAYLAIDKAMSASVDTSDVVVSNDPEDSGTDTGIDAISIFVNGVLITDVDQFADVQSSSSNLEVDFIFVQAERSAGFDGAKIGTFTFGVIDFFKDAPSLHRNPKVESAAKVRRAIYSQCTKFRREPPRCKMFYVTTGKVLSDSHLDARISAPVDDLRSLQQFSSVTFERIGADGINKMYHAAKDFTEATIRFVNKVPIDLKINGVKQAYAGYLPWSEFSKIIINEAGALQRGLFVDNVRDWQGIENTVNGEIQSTLQSENKNRFVLMNNGVTIIARDLKLASANEIAIEGYRIVNGCQTSNVLYENRAALDDSVLIPVRLIGTTDEDVTNAVVRATNRQTTVKEDQFLALEDFAKKLEAFFHAYPCKQRVYFERRSKQYDNTNIEKARVISFANLVRSFAGMFRNEPHRTTKNYSGLIAQTGTEIMSDTHRLEPYYACALAWYRVDSAFRREKIPAKLKPARFHLLLALRVLSVGWEMPAIGSNKMEAYAKLIIAALEDQATFDALLTSAEKIIHEAAGNNYDRDELRKESFTEAVIKLSKTAKASE